MDDRVQELLDRTKEAAGSVGDAAGATVRYVGQRADELVTVSKRKIKIFELESAKTGLLREVGQTVYDTLRTGESQDERLEELVERLDEIDEDLEELVEENARRRNTKECPACGTVCGQSDRYCKDCGAAL